MEVRLQKLRNQAYYLIWQTYKSEYTMKDMAEVFRVSLPYLYRIIKNEQKRHIQGTIYISGESPEADSTSREMGRGEWKVKM